MFSRSLAFHGFDAQPWSNLLSLFGYRHPAQDRRSPLLVVVEDADGSAIAAFRTDHGPIPVALYTGRDQFGALCEQQGCHQGVVLREGALETLAERAAAEMAMDGTYLEQWLTVLAALRRAEQEGTISYHPPRALPPLASAAMVERAVDLLVPDGRSLVLCVWQGNHLWTAVALRRQAGHFDTIAGPATIERWTGPLGGDYRRDHRAIKQAVSTQLAPTHLGIFARRHDLERLLRSAEPGAWLQAVALREVILDPAPTYAGVALTADAARALTLRARTFLGGLDPFAHITPVLTQLRDRMGQTGSVTRLLGFNPLERLAERLKRTDEQRDDGGR